MFLHIGRDYVIPLKSIIAIMDLEKTTISKDTREFLKIAEEEGFIVNVSDDIPKTFIVTESDKKSKIYLTSISSVTLQKRADIIREIEESEKVLINKKQIVKKEEDEEEKVYDEGSEDMVVDEVEDMDMDIDDENMNNIE